MAITTFLSEKIRDPRVRGASSSSTYTENFSVLFSASNQTGTYIHKLKYDPNPGTSSSNPGSIRVVIPSVNFNQTFNMGTSTTKTKTANKVKVTVIFNGRRTLTINYEGQSGFNTNISDTVTISYQTQVSNYIEVMYMTGEAEDLWSRTGAPTIYIRGKLADGNSVSSANITANAVTSAKINNNAVTNAKIANASVATEKIADGAVTTVKIADVSVTSAKIANSAVITEKINNSAVTSAKIANTSVTTEKIKDSAVTSAKIASNAVTNAKIASNAVTNAKIANESVTSEKIKFTFTNLTTPTGETQRVKITFAQGA